MTRELPIQRTLLGETRLLHGLACCKSGRQSGMYDSAWFMSIAHLLPRTKRFCYRMVGQLRIVRANARRFFRTARHVNFIVLKSKQNRRVPIADTSERRHGIAGLFERLSEVTCPRARTVAHKTSPRVISDAEIIPDTTQRSNDR